VLPYESGLRPKTRHDAPERFLSGFRILRVYSCKQKMTDSHTLLSQYARTGSESAFRELVSRYIDLVYSTAYRLLDGDAQSAQDVAQTVFVALAIRARTLPVPRNPNIARPGAEPPLSEWTRASAGAGACFLAAAFAFGIVV
jgi:hypothetical protein